MTSFMPQPKLVWKVSGSVHLFECFYVANPTESLGHVSEYQLLRIIYLIWDGVFLTMQIRNKPLNLSLKTMASSSTENTQKL